MTPNPEKSRVDAATVAEFNPAVARLRKTLSSGKDSEDAFRQWRSSPVTRMFLDALAELVDSQPSGISGAGAECELLVQYGVTTGLSLAYKLLTQPNRLYPEVFRGDAVPQPTDYLLDRAFEDTDTADAVIDRL